MGNNAVVLPNSKTVREKVRAVFSSSGRKVALVAFVGADAEIYLGPNAKGVEIYCWPQAGGTNPRAIQDLIHKYKCDVHFVNRLHMKIFWSERGGCVIGSANLTNNALGDDGLLEAGVFLPKSGSVNIDRIINALPARRVTKSSLEKLFRAHKAYFAKNGAGKTQRKQKSFIDWYYSTPHEPWKLGWWEDSFDNSPPSAVRMAKSDFDMADAKDFLLGKKDNFAQDDWVLAYRINEDTGKIGQVYWLYVERIIKSTEKERKRKEWSDSLDKWPYEAVQFHSTSYFGSPPFDEKDKHFLQAFRVAGKRLGTKMMMPNKDCNPPKLLIKRIADMLQ